MIDIKELITNRQRKDPAFRVLREPGGNRFFLRDQVLFIFRAGIPAEVAKQQVNAYVDWANAQPGKRVTVRVINLIVFPNGLVSVEGASVSSIVDLLAKGGGTPPPPPPPPPWQFVAVIPNYIYATIVLVGLNKTLFSLTTEREIRLTNERLDLPVNDGELMAQVDSGGGTPPPPPPPPPWAV